MRSLLKRKRKANARVDDVEDGGRAIAIEEGLSAFVFEAASRVGFYADADRVDSDVLRLCCRLTANLEVGVCTSREWERAILDGYASWRLLRQHGHAAVICDLDARTISARPLMASELSAHADICTRALHENAAAKGPTARS